MRAGTKIIEPGRTSKVSTSRSAPCAFSPARSQCSKPRPPCAVFAGPSLPCSSTYIPTLREETRRNSEYRRGDRASSSEKSNTLKCMDHLRQYRLAQLTHVITPRRIGRGKRVRLENIWIIDNESLKTHYKLIPRQDTARG